MLVQRSPAMLNTAAFFLILSQSASGFVSFRGSNGLGSSSSLSMSAALIVQNKGGGHGELGYQLAKKLASNPKISSITILQDDACNDEQEPFMSYSSDLPDVKVVKATLADESMTADNIMNLLGNNASFEYVWDNASKGPVGSGKAICDAAKTWTPRLFTYVSSAGMYQPTDETEFPMDETTPIKESAGQAKFDAYAVELGLPLVSFRPQYIYGPKANKYDYIDYYFDRIVRGEPIPIPGDGTQIVSLTNSEDVASILVSPLNDEAAAIEQRFFNCGTDVQLSYDDVAKLCADAAGVSDYKVVHFDASELGKGKFPFRPTNFFVAPDKAKELLKWGGAQHTLREDLPAYYESYKARGGATKDLDLSADKEILEAVTA